MHHPRYRTGDILKVLYKAGGGLRGHPTGVSRARLIHSGPWEWSKHDQDWQRVCILLSEKRAIMFTAVAAGLMYWRGQIHRRTVCVHSVIYLHTDD